MRFIEKQIQTNHSFTKHRQFWWFFFFHSNFHRRSYHCVVFNAVSSSSSSYSLCRAPFTNKIYPQTHKRHKHHVHLTISPYNILLINCMLHSHSSPLYIHRLWALFLSVPFLSSSYKKPFSIIELDADDLLTVYWCERYERRRLNFNAILAYIHSFTRSLAHQSLHP